jgi:hypothetical protein
MEDDLNFKLNGRQLHVKYPKLALASPELGTAQPELVLYKIKIDGQARVFILEV